MKRKFNENENEKENNYLKLMKLLDNDNKKKNLKINKSKFNDIFFNIYNKNKLLLDMKMNLFITNKIINNNNIYDDLIDIYNYSHSTDILFMILQFIWINNNENLIHKIKNNIYPFNDFHKVIINSISLNYIMDLSSRPISDKEVYEFCKYIKYCNYLKHLNLSNDYIRNIGIITLFNNIHNLTNIQSINISSIIHKFR